MKLSAAAREARTQYQREWRKNNRDKVRIYEETYWERRVSKLKASKEGDTNVDI